MANFNLSYESGKLAYVDPSGNAVSVITPAWIAPEYSKRPTQRMNLPCTKASCTMQNRQLGQLKTGRHLIGRKLPLQVCF